MARIGDDADDAPPEARSIARLHRAGWTIGDVVLRGDDGRPRWLVSGSNGENLVRAEGATAAEAWTNAKIQAQLLGILGRALGQIL